MVRVFMWLAVQVSSILLHVSSDALTTINRLDRIYYTK